jgi:hypothetical protein
MVSRAFYKREEKGYKPDSLPPVRYPSAVLQRIHSSRGEPWGMNFVDDGLKNANSHIDFVDLLQEKPTGIITQNMHADNSKEFKEIRYSDLQKTADSSRAVKNELAALDHLISHHPKELEREMTLGTSYMDILDEEAGKFLNSLLHTMYEKKLYGNDFTMADIGTSSGAFTDKPISYVLEKFKNPKIIRTNPAGLQIKAHKELEVRIHDITDGPVGEKFDLVIIKDIMKFFTEEGKARIWENVAQDVKEGGFIVDGSVGTFKLHIKHNEELVKVDSDAFLKELAKLESYPSYLDNVGDIIARCPPKNQD